MVSTTIKKLQFQKKTDTACDPGLDKIKQYQIQYIKIENGQIKHDWNALFIFLRLFFILAVSDLTSPFFSASRLNT
jgi:hypothetical protein